MRKEVNASNHGSRCDPGSWTEGEGYPGAMKLTWELRLHGLGHGVHPTAEGHAAIDPCAIVVSGGPADGVVRE
jgi:hypothetical protein